jgi:hypothetical protein
LTSKYGFSVVLDRRQQRVLLGLVEPVDLVQKEDRRLVGRLPTLLRALDDRPHLRATGVHRRFLLEGTACGRRDDPREGGLAGPGRPVEDRRMGLSRLDRDPQR